MHPELFELKALVAGRLDAHRRREIDDHLGSCADCPRHYVALMLGSASPKTAEAEAREALVPSGAGTVLTLGGNSAALVEVYGIDAPLPPAAPKPRPTSGQSPALETEFPAAPARTPVPVSASLVDAIARLRAEAEAPKPAPAATLAPEIVAPVAESPLIEPSIFTPTPADGVSIIRPAQQTPSATPAAERPSFMTRPASTSPSASAAQPELVVTFSSTPTRTSSYRSPSSVAVVTPSAEQDYVSQAVPTSAMQPATDFQVTNTTVGRAPQAMSRNLVLGGAVLALVLAFSGYRYFQSSVREAAAAAAAAAAKQVQQAAATRSPTPAPVAAAAEPAPVQTRIVYVERPARRSGESSRSTTDESTRQAPSATPSVPVAVTLPDVNVGTGAAESATQTNTQRSATSELTRSARATATRTAAPRPY